MIQVNLLPSASEIAKFVGLLSSDLREEVFFSRLSGEILNFVEGDHAEVYICYNDESTKLISRDGKVVTDSEKMKRGAGVSGYVAKTKRAYYSNSVISDPVFAESKRDGINSEIVFPLNIDGNVIATLHIQAKDKSYSDDDLAKLKSFINELSAPLKNINLYLMAKFLNDELTHKLEKNGEIEVKNSPEVALFQPENIEIIGQDEKLLKAISMAKKVAQHDFPVLLQGEVGVGKRLLCKKIHNSGLRAKSAFFVIECKTQSEELLEKDLFGFEERAGLWELAEGGTLVFNDIRHLSSRLQSKILNVMTTGLCKRFHSNKPFSVNARIIATSQVDLKDLVANNKFRDDLFYRLATITIDLPSLKDRKDDIKIIANHLLSTGAGEKKVLTPKAIDQLVSHSWPSNIIELRNAIERTKALSEGKYIENIEMDSHSLESEEKSKIGAVEAFSLVSLQDLEKRHICLTLEHLNGNKTRAAKALGITVKTLYNKLHSYDLITKSAQ